MVSCEDRNVSGTCMNEWISRWSFSCFLFSTVDVIRGLKCIWMSFRSGYSCYKEISLLRRIFVWFLWCSRSDCGWRRCDGKILQNVFWNFVLYECGYKSNIILKTNWSKGAQKITFDHTGLIDSPFHELQGLKRAFKQAFIWLFRMRLVGVMTWKAFKYTFGSNGLTNWGH